MNSIAQARLVDGRRDLSVSHWNLALVVLAFVLIYLEVSIWSGGELLFPNIGGFAVAILSFLLNSKSITRKAVSSLLLILVLAALLTGAAAFIGGSFYASMWRSFAQFAASLISAYGIYLATINSERRMLAAVFFAFFWMIVIGSLLETTGWLAGLSERARQALYAGDFLYSADFRDLVTYGGFRPRFFAREPSLVGISAGFALVGWILTSRFPANIKILLTVVSVAIAILVVKSPTVAFFGAIALCGIVLTGPGSELTRSLSKPVFVTVLGGFILFVPIIQWFSLLTGGRLQDFLAGGSFYVRMIGPPQVAFEVWWNSPLVGYGLGGFDALFDTVRRVYSALGVFARYHWLADEVDARNMLSNAFWEYWIFFGLAGGIALLFPLRRFLLSLGLTSTLFPFLAITITLQTFGGLTILRASYFFLTYAAIAMVCAESTRLGARQTVPRGEGETGAERT